MTNYSNPFEAPRAPLGEVVGVKSGRLEDLRKVASYQRAILICILIYIVTFMGQFAVPPAQRTILAVLTFCVSLVATVFVFMLAMKVYSRGLGILLGILAIIPCIGLLVLLMINDKATKILRQNGYKVGFLGADMSQFSKP
jgi:hypothetical protein